jgi:hypothetical protein
MPQMMRTRTSAGTTPSNILPPSISGTPVNGNTLTCNPGQWQALQPFTVAYQWFRNPSTPIGTNAPTYAVVVGDATFTIRCQVTVTNVLGTATLNTPNTVAAT